MMKLAELFEKFAVKPLDSEFCHVCGRPCKVVYKGGR